MKKAAYAILIMLLALALFSCGERDYSDEELIELAKSAVAEKYGSDYADFSDCEILRRNEVYSVSMKKTYGENGLITLYECSAEINRRGKVLSVTGTELEEFSGFEESMLNGVDAELLTKLAKEKALQKYGGAEDLALTDCRIGKEDGMLVVSVKASFVTYSHPIVDGKRVCQCSLEAEAPHSLTGQCSFPLQFAPVENGELSAPDIDRIEYVERKDFELILGNRYASYDAQDSHAIFTDNGNYNYIYDKDGGTFYGVVAAESEKSDYLEAIEAGRAKPLSDEERIEIARAAALSLFGAEYASFNDCTVFDDRITENETDCNVLLGRSLGEDDFLPGYACFARVEKDGRLTFLLMTDHKKLDGFDESLLDGLTKDSLYAYAEDKLTERYIKIEDLSPTGIRLRRDGSRERLYIEAEFTAKKEPGGEAEIRCICGAPETLGDEERRCLWTVVYELNADEASD